MKIQISLHDGTAINADVPDYNAADMAKDLNDPKILMVTVGQIIVNKNAVKMVAPVVDQPTE
ncbi:hypothetical protein SFC50_16085 [Bacillus infantis]|uniref:hypothetical protein n=1 Tax=Bacillus infantis TaxID=324767 RepID=UPI003982083F